jgi:small redox-active disulfide protein 2
MKIQVLGTGCKSCDKMYENVLSAIARQSKNIEVEKVKDISYFAQKGVFMTPGLIIDEKVVSTGKVLSVEEIEDKIKENM